MKKRLLYFIIVLLCFVCVFTLYHAIRYRRACLQQPPLSWETLSWETLWNKTPPKQIKSALPHFDDPLKKIYNDYFSQKKLLSFQANSETEAKIWKDKLRKKLLELLGYSKEPQTLLKPELLERVDLGDVVREKVSYAGYHSRAVAYVFIPKTKIKTTLPALAIFTGHGPGVVGTLPGALRISKKGYIVIAPENIRFGMRKSNFIARKVDSILGLLFGKPFQGVFLFESMRAIDYLWQRKEVDTTRIGAVGCSLGGEITFYLSAIDERIKCCVVSGFLTTYKKMLDHIACACSVIPGILKYAETGDVASLIAPRPANFQIGRKDPWQNPRISKSAFERIRKAYKVYGVEKNVKFSLLEGGDSLNIENALNWFEEHL